MEVAIVGAVVSDKEGKSVWNKRVQSESYTRPARSLTGPWETCLASGPVA